MNDTLVNLVYLSLIAKLSPGCQYSFPTFSELVHALSCKQIAQAQYKSIIGAQGELKLC